MTSPHHNVTVDERRQLDQHNDTYFIGLCLGMAVLTLIYIYTYIYTYVYKYIYTYVHKYILTYLHIYLWARSIYKAISSNFMGNVVIIIATFAYTNKSNENSSFVNAFECRLVWASKLSERIFFAFLFVYFFCWRVYYSHHRGLKVSHVPTTIQQQQQQQ